MGFELFGVFDLFDLFGVDCWDLFCCWFVHVANLARGVFVLGYGVVDFYPDSYSKMALALSGAQLAKENLVGEFGVGEDIPFNFFGWEGDCLSVVVSLNRVFMKESIEKRFELCAGAVGAMRQYFGCDAITFVAEGFHSSRPELTRGKNLRELYGAHDRNVRECISVCHVELLPSMQPFLTLASVTYQYLAGKWVIWDDNVQGFTRGVEEVMRDSPFAAMISGTLRAGVESADFEELSRVIEVLGNNGFNVQAFNIDAEDY